MKELKIKISIIFLFAFYNIGAQIIFYCPIDYEESKMYIESRCTYFFNYTTGGIDSIPSDGNLLLDQNKVIKIRLDYNDQNKKNGTIKYHLEDKVILEGQFVNGLAHGEFYYLNNYDTIYANYSNGLLEGERVTKTSDAITFYENFKKGQLNGPSYELDQDGKYLFFSNYRNGKKEGLEFTLYDNGMLSSFFIYKEGKLSDGTYYKFDGEGEVIYEMIVSMGKVKKMYYD